MTSNKQKSLWLGLAHSYWWIRTGSYLYLSDGAGGAGGDLMHRGDVHYSSLKSLPAHDPRTRLSSTSSGGLPSRVFKISQVYDGKYTARKCNWLRYCLALCDEIVALSVTYSEICLNSVLVQYCTYSYGMWPLQKENWAEQRDLLLPFFREQ